MLLFRSAFGEWVWDYGCLYERLLFRWEKKKKQNHKSEAIIIQCKNRNEMIKQQKNIKMSLFSLCLFRGVWIGKQEEEELKSKGEMVVIFREWVFFVPKQCIWRLMSLLHGGIFFRWKRKCCLNTRTHTSTPPQMYTFTVSSQKHVESPKKKSNDHSIQWFRCVMV